MQAEKRLAEEVERVKNYLDESTEPKITRVAENELIAAQVRWLGWRPSTSTADCLSALLLAGLWHL